MSMLEEFNTLTDTEEFLDFFEIEYDEQLVYVKRFHILKKFGEMVDKAKTHSFESDEKLLEFYRFALLSVYKNFENGYNPSAAEVWNMFNNPSACSSCSTSTSCSTVEEVQNGVHSCTREPSISFN